MKLMRVGGSGAERPAMLCPAGRMRDLSGHVNEIGGEALTPAGLDRLRALDPTTLPELPSTIRVGPCVGRPGKLVCVGLNYSDHADELGMNYPEEPILFSKATSSLAGPYDDIEMPRDGEALDYEIELAVVIGAKARYVSRAQALNHVAGYALFNDVSERNFQTRRGGQWMKGKSHDGFGPLGPWLVTADEVPDPQALELELSVNGGVRQKGSTGRMIFSVAELISYISRFMTLEPGDIIPTGTPPGVAMGMSPPAWLVPGDVLELAIEGLGAQRCRILPPP
ncbi:MAG: fumarylacetoacetate hydrolase family protein [Pseudomonadota bacterium]